MLIYFVLVVVGLIAGGIVNAMADDLPYRRNVGIPTYPDGTPRPPSAWLGITAFLLGQREPSEKAPNEARERYTEKDNRLTWRYPITEILTIALMILAYVGTQQMLSDVSTLQVIFYLVYMAIFILITVIDVEHHLILFIVTIPSIVLGLVDAILLSTTGPTIVSALSGAGAGFGVFFAMYLGGMLFNTVMSRVRGVEMNTVAFGFGDVMLITFSGVLLGLENIFFALFVTVFLGAVGATIYLIARQLAGEYVAFEAIPYGPYIVAGTIIILLYAYPVQCAIWNWSLEGPCF